MLKCGHKVFTRLIWFNFNFNVRLASVDSCFPPTSYRDMNLAVWNRLSSLPSISCRQNPNRICTMNARFCASAASRRATVLAVAAKLSSHCGWFSRKSRHPNRTRRVSAASFVVIACPKPRACSSIPLALLAARHRRAVPKYGLWHPKIEAGIDARSARHGWFSRSLREQPPQSAFSSTLTRSLWSPSTSGGPRSSVGAEGCSSARCSSTSHNGFHEPLARSLALQERGSTLPNWAPPCPRQASRLASCCRPFQDCAKEDWHRWYMLAVARSSALSWLAVQCLMHWKCRRSPPTAGRRFRSGSYGSERPRSGRESSVAADIQSPFASASQYPRWFASRWWCAKRRRRQRPTWFPACGWRELVARGCRTTVGFHRQSVWLCAFRFLRRAWLAVHRRGLPASVGAKEKDSSANI